MCHALRVALGSMVAVSSERLMDDGKPSLPHSIWNVERTGTTHGFKLLGQTVLTAGWPLSVACSRNSSSSASPVQMGRLVASLKLNKLPTVFTDSKASQILLTVFGWWKCSR